MVLASSLISFLISLVIVRSKFAGRKVLDVKYVYAHPGGPTGRWIGIDITHTAA